MPEAGSVYSDPSTPGVQVRVMPGDPYDPHPVKRGPYVIVRKPQTYGDFIPLAGNPTLAHGADHAVERTWDISRRILELASIDEIGLWELEWDATGAPELGWTRSSITNACLSFARRKWILFHEGPPFGGGAPLSPVLLELALMKDSAWQPPETITSRHIRLLITDDGLSEYYKLISS